MGVDELALSSKRSERRQSATRQGTDWWAELRGLVWLVLGVLAFHSLIAKPFYIPSESMLPTLRVGDQLIVSKYPYGYSFVTPTFHMLPPIPGRILGRLPERGDIVIVTPPQHSTDYIKRVIGLPGDTIAVRDGIVWLNGKQVAREPLGERLVPIDGNTRCDPDPERGGSIFYEGRRVVHQGKAYCSLTLFRETLPNGASYDIADLGDSAGDSFPPTVVPKHHVFLMGDNRDNSADSRFSLEQGGLGGPVPWENLGGRAEFITFSRDGSSTWNPLTWFTGFRGDRFGISLHPTHEDK
ncbi:signal peptidase I [Sphingomonas sp.]|uniref:signal peptidase I n=1 Tax=Sphingomonas sp. TaxID=28214 RepID=UPI0028B225D9|nr:signal peptidase I [Sphingomonas sp.]